MQNRYDFVVNLTREAGEMVLKAREKHVDVSIKNDDPRDFLTNVDLEVSDFLKVKIKEIFPNEIVYSEESAEVDVTSGSFWSVDPIDGTANFTKNIPHFAVVVSYVEKGLPITGAIYNPVTREMFSFEKDKGAFLNGERIKVSEVKDLIESTVILSAGRKPEIQEWAKKAYNFLLGNVNKVRILSCSGLDICFVAAGRADACLYGQLTTIDIVAALGILKEAGGIVEARTGLVDKLSKDHKTIFISNNQEIMSAIKVGA